MSELVPSYGGMLWVESHPRNGAWSSAGNAMTPQTQPFNWFLSAEYRCIAISVSGIVVFFISENTDRTVGKSTSVGSGLRGRHFDAVGLALRHEGRGKAYHEAHDEGGIPVVSRASGGFGWRVCGKGGGLWARVRALGGGGGLRGPSS